MRGCHEHHGGFGSRFYTVEEEIEMLEKVKEAFETQFNNINTRLEKLKA